jgi:cytochrome c oxidase assembly factor CtaG
VDNVPLTMGDALTSWQFAPVASAVLALLAAGYLLAVWRVGRRHPARPWPARRTLAFLLALAVTAIATQSSIGVYDDVLFSVHMVQHLLLIMVAPPLLVAARPVTLLLHASRNPVHSWVKRAVRSRVMTALTWPPVAALLYAAVVAVTHLTPLMNLVLENGAVHDAEHALYLVAGYLYFLPVIGSEPIRWRLSPFGRYMLLLATMPVDTAVGIILMIVPHELFPAYARAGRAWGPSLLADLHEGGLIMWVGSDIIMIVLGIAVAARFVYTPAGRRPAAGSENARLEAYNAYLASLATPGPDPTGARPPAGASRTAPARQPPASRG